MSNASPDLTGITIVPGTTFNIPYGDGAGIWNGLTNNGTIIVGSGSGTGTAQLTFRTSSETLSGTGSIVLQATNNDPSTARVNSVSTVTQPAGHTISGQGQVTAAINNLGTIMASGGTLNVTGAVANYSGTTLTGGTWTANSNSTLNITSAGNVLTNNANVILNGSGAAFTNINHLSNNQGSFCVENGDNFTTAGNFSNTGSVIISGGGTFTVNGSLTQLVGNTLTGGTWTVGASSTLGITTGGNIATNQGNVTLDGTGSTFDKINTLADNQGNFSVLDGRSFTTAGDLANSGTLLVSGGGTFNVSGSLTGAGNTTVTDSSLLYANSIAQNTLTIGEGATVVIRAISGGPMAGAENINPVPEPEAWLLILIAFFAWAANKKIAMFYHER